MKRNLVILLGLILAAGCEYEDQVGTGIDAELEGESFAEVDTDANGLISEDEAQILEALADNFDQADDNGSGYVNRSEFEKALGQQNLQE